MKVSDEEVRSLVDAMVDLWVAGLPPAGLPAAHVMLESLTARELRSALAARGWPMVAEAKLRRMLDAAYRFVECSWGERPSYSRDYPTMATGRYHRVSVYAPRKAAFIERLRAAGHL